MNQSPNFKTSYEFINELQLDINGREYHGYRFAKNQKKLSTFVAIHGATSGNPNRLLSFAKSVVEMGLSIVTVDHSGCNKDYHFQQEMSLKERVFEVDALIKKYVDHQAKDLTFYGESMGGYVAIKLAEKYRPKNLILFCPAIYDFAAFDVPFGPDFSTIIRKDESWKKSDAGKVLQNFKGNMLLIIGDKDTVIPSGVIDYIDIHTQHLIKKEIIKIPGAPHKMHEWMLSNPTEAQQIADKVVHFLNEG